MTRGYWSRSGWLHCFGMDGENQAFSSAFKMGVLDTLEMELAVVCIVSMQKWNTVLSNTIQLLFPKEAETQRAASANLKGRETPTPRNSASFQERLQREDISLLLVFEERSERQRSASSMRLDEDKDAAFENNDVSSSSVSTLSPATSLNLP